MKMTPWYLAALAPLAVASWSGALFGHVAVLAVTIGIFVGTLSLGREMSQGPDPLARARTTVTQLDVLASSESHLPSTSPSAGGLDSSGTHAFDRCEQEHQAAFVNPEQTLPNKAA